MTTHQDVLNELNRIYTAKNQDYGNSFETTFREFGITAAFVRLTDKLERAKQVARAEAQVQSETLRDTLLDLANYAVMTVMALDNGGGWGCT